MKKKKKNNVKIVLISLIVIVLMIGLYFVVNTFYITEQITTIPMDLRVADEVGFNVDTDALHFGAVSEQGCSTRMFNVTNNRDYKIRIVIEKKGNISNFVSLDSYDFKIPPKDAKTLKARACVPIGAVKGNYTGTLTVFFRKF